MGTVLTWSFRRSLLRVLAFGASVGVLSAVTRGFQNLVLTTVEVEKSLDSINSILGTSDKQLKDFGKTIFDVATVFHKTNRRRLPVLEQGRLVGQISRQDVVKAALLLRSQRWR